MIYRIQIVTITRQAPTLMIHPAYLARSLYFFLKLQPLWALIFNELARIIKPASSYNDYSNNADLLNFSEYLHYALTDI